MLGETPIFVAENSGILRKLNILRIRIISHFDRGTT